MKIGVVTVTYNSAAVIDDFLDSLFAQTHGEFILYGVDNASKDDAIARIRARGDRRVVVIENRDNLGVAAGNNQGISAAIKDGCDGILLLNNDTVFPENLFETLVADLEQSHADMVTPKITYYDRPDLIWCAGGEFVSWLAGSARHYGLLCADDGTYDTPRWISYTPTCCVLIKSSVIDQVGLMDEAYFVYCDDADFMFRAHQRGFKLLYTPHVTLRHKVSALTGGGLSPFTVRYETRNQIYFIRKHYPLSWPAWVCAHWARLTLRALIGKDPLPIMVARYKALSEGLRMTLPAVEAGVPRGARQ